MSLRALPSPLDGAGNNAAASGASLSPGLPGNATLATSTGSVASLNKSRTRNPYAAQPTPPNTLRPASTAQSPSGARPENAPGDAAADDIDVHSAASDGDDGGIDLPIAARPAKEEDDGVERSPGLRPGGKRTVQQALDRSAYSYSRMSPGISFNVNTDANPLEASDRAPFSGLRVAFPLSHARSQERVLPPPPAEAIGSTPPILRPDDGNRDDHTLVSDRDTRGTSTAHRDVDASEAKSAVESNVPASVQSEAPSLGGLSASALQDAIAGGTVDVACPPGFVLTVYNGDISQHFSIPSEHVQITRGAIKYVDHHARYGAQTRFRFQLCHNFLLRKCPKLSECSYIHATQLPAPTQVHLNPFAPRRSSSNRQVPSATHDDPSVADTYPTFESGYFVPLFPPSRPRDPSGAQLDPVSSNAAVVVVPSEKLIVTEGAKELLLMLPALPPRQLSALRTAPEAVAAVMHELPHPVVHKARHCAHYQFKRLCNLGANCQYIHSKVPLLTVAKAQQLHGSDPASVSSHAPRPHPTTNTPQQQGSAQPSLSGAGQFALAPPQQPPHASVPQYSVAGQSPNTSGVAAPHALPMGTPFPVPPSAGAGGLLHPGFAVPFHHHHHLFHPHTLGPAFAPHHRHGLPTSYPIPPAVHGGAPGPAGAPYAPLQQPPPPKSPPAHASGGPAP